MTNQPRGYIEGIILKLSSSLIVQKSAKVVISSNSKDILYNKRLKKICEKNSVQLIQQKPCSANVHFNDLYKNCATDLFMILHDDDDIFIDEFNKYISKVLVNPGFCSYSCNDKILIGEKVKVNRIDHNDIMVADNFTASIAYILNRHLICFPSIIYNRAKLKINFLDDRFGKHTDAFIVTKLIRAGHLFIGQPAIGYRIHDQQDSAVNDNIKIKLKVYLLFLMLLSLGQAKLSCLKFLLLRIRYGFNN